MGDSGAEGGRGPLLEIATRTSQEIEGELRERGADSTDEVFHPSFKLQSSALVKRRPHQVQKKADGARGGIPAAVYR